jgi:DnaJ family protein C protein 17
MCVSRCPRRSGHGHHLTSACVVLWGTQELIAREEEAKKAKLARFDAMQQATEEERIKEAGRRMREQAQARAAAASQTQAKVNTAFGAAYSDAFAAFGGGTQDGPQRPHLQPLRSSFEQQDMARMKGTANDEARPPITAEDLRLTLQFPALPTDGLPLFLQSEDAFTAEIRQRYGPVEHVILRQGKPAKQGKKASGKGIKAIIEFKERNWDGCWECWRDHSDDSSPAARPLVPKTKAKWAAVDGQTPAWVAWAQRQRGKSQMATPTSADGATPPRSYTPAASFPAAPSSFPASSAPPTKSNKDDSFESTTLFRMRQLERERMEERLRREEEEE